MARLGALAAALAAAGCFEARTFAPSLDDAGDAPDGPSVDAAEVDAPTGRVDARVDAPADAPIDAPAGDPTLARAPQPCSTVTSEASFLLTVPAGYTLNQYAPVDGIGTYSAYLCGTSPPRRHGLSVAYSGAQVPLGSQPAHTIYRTGLPSTFTISYVVEEADLGGDPEVGLIGPFVLAVVTSPTVTYGGVYLAKRPDGVVVLRGGTETTPLGYDLAVLGALAPPYRISFRVTSTAGQLAAGVDVVTASGRAAYSGAVPAPLPPGGLELQLGTNRYLPTGQSKVTFSELVLP